MCHGFSVRVHRYEFVVSGFGQFPGEIDAAPTSFLTAIAVVTGVAAELCDRPRSIYPDGGPLHVVDVPENDATSVTQTSVALTEVAVGQVAELLPVPVPSG